MGLQLVHLREDPITPLTLQSKIMTTDFNVLRGKYTLVVD